MADEKKKSSLPRILSLIVALIGCVITAVPFAFGMGGNPAPIILVGSGVTVIALGLFLFFSI
jgi:protein-S-isoprenylcysteine O-methyltransferase Ste14